MGVKYISPKEKILKRLRQEFPHVAERVLLSAVWDVEMLAVRGQLALDGEGVPIFTTKDWKRIPRVAAWFKGVRDASS